MTNTVENICYEYSEDVLFSQDVCEKGNPIKIICYINSMYLGELSMFLHNHSYSLASVKKFGKYFILVRFILKSKLNKKKIIEDRKREEF